MLPLFAAASASPSGSGLAAAAGAADGLSEVAAVAADGLSEAEARDVIFNVGGPVWAMDWCPAEAAGADALQAAGSGDFVAISCHPLDSHQNVIGTAVQGGNCVQIWHISHPQNSSQQQRQQQRRQQECGSVPPPRLALALAHDGGLAWDCRWCPDPGLADIPTAAARESQRDTLPRCVVQ